jgi:hypothetical protein
MEFIMKSIPVLKFLCFSYIVLMFGCNSDKSVQEENNIPPTIDGFQTLSSVSFNDNNSLTSNASFTVNASDIDGSIASYKWSLLSSQDIQLHDTETVTTSLEIPLISSEDQNLMIIEATVTDNKESQTSSTYKLDINDYLTVFIYDIEARTGDESELRATIHGRQSKISKLLWSVDSGHEITLFDADTKVVSFVAPDVNEITEVTLRLDVTTIDVDTFNPDGLLITHKAKVKILPR